MNEKEQNIWGALHESVSPLDEHYEQICGWVRDGIADGTLTPAGIPSLVEKFRRVLATHQAIAEKAGTLDVDVTGPTSTFDAVKPMKVSL